MTADGRTRGLGSLLRILGATGGPVDAPEQAGGLLCSRGCAHLFVSVTWLVFCVFQPSWFTTGSPPLKNKTDDRQVQAGRSERGFIELTGFRLGLSLGTGFEKMLSSYAFPLHLPRLAYFSRD